MAGLLQAEHGGDEFGRQSGVVRQFCNDGAGMKTNDALVNPKSRNLRVLTFGIGQ